MASAYGPSMEGAGTRVCGYAIKNGELTVEVIRQHLHVCVRTPCQDPKSSGVARTGLDGRGPYRNKLLEMGSLGPRYSGSGDIGHGFVDFKGPKYRGS